MTGRKYAWGRRIVIAAILALSSILALMGAPASAATYKYIWP
jgi:hypothetical protein